MGMTSLERVTAAINHQEPDRVPLCLNATYCVARGMGLTPRQLFASVDNIVEAQLRVLRQFGSDIVSSYPFAGVEAQAFGSEVQYFEAGPPNAGAPVIKGEREILALTPPVPQEVPALRQVLEATEALRRAVGPDTPIAGVVISPFSLPIMQMGFEAYLELMYFRPELTDLLLAVNREFCVAWGNAQLRAGATALVYSDPMSSPTITPGEISSRHGLPMMRQVLSRLEGPAVVHLASGRGLPLLEDIAQAGAVGMSISTLEDLAQAKRACAGRLVAMGNLNAVEMPRWSPQQAEAQVKRAIALGGPGGGFVLADNHGEIPWQVGEEVLLAIAEAARRWGAYPLDWVKQLDRQ